MVLNCLKNAHTYFILKYKRSLNTEESNYFYEMIYFHFWLLFNLRNENASRLLEKYLIACKHTY